MLASARKILLHITNMSGECLSLIKADYSSNIHEGNDTIIGRPAHYQLLEHMHAANEISL